MTVTSFEGALYQGTHAVPLPGVYAPDVLNVRTCGCDMDVWVYGHRTCHGRSHRCWCSLCQCSCHQREAA